jgi:hypothetical protein
LQQQATTRKNVHNLQESNAKKIPLQQKMKKKKRKKKAIKRGEGGGRKRRRRILVLPENLFSEAHLKHLFIKLQILRRLHQSIQLSLIQWHYKSCPPPCELTPFPSLLFSSLPQFPPPLSNKPPHFLPRLYTQNTQLHFLFSLRSLFLDSASQQ